MVEDKTTVEGYCVKCKQKVTMKDNELTTTKNGRKMQKGKCPKCSTTVCKFVKG